MPAHNLAPGPVDEAITVDPGYPDTYFFRGILRAATGQLAAAQADLQTYLAGNPNAAWSDAARDALAEVTLELEKTSTTVPTTG